MCQRWCICQYVWLYWKMHQIFKVVICDKILQWMSWCFCSWCKNQLWGRSEPSIYPFSSLHKYTPFYFAQTALCINIVFNSICSLDIWGLFHSSIKEIVLAFPISARGECFHISLYSTTAMIDPLWFQLLLYCRHLIEKCGGSLASDTACTIHLWNETDSEKSLQ